MLIFMFAKCDTGETHFTSMWMRFAYRQRGFSARRSFVKPTLSDPCVPQQARLIDSLLVLVLPVGEEESFWLEGGWSEIKPCQNLICFRPKSRIARFVFSIQNCRWCYNMRLDLHAWPRGSWGQVGASLRSNHRCYSQGVQTRDLTE